MRPGPGEGLRIPWHDIATGMEEFAKARVPEGRTVIYSCYRVYGAAFTRRLKAARVAWEDKVRKARALASSAKART